jgi:hypothetical protein
MDGRLIPRDDSHMEQSQRCALLVGYSAHIKRVAKRIWLI